MKRVPRFREARGRPLFHISSSFAMVPWNRAAFSLGPIPNFYPKSPRTSQKRKAREIATTSSVAPRSGQGGLVDKKPQAEKPAYLDLGSARSRFRT